MAFLDRLKHGWNAFLNDEEPRAAYSYGFSYGTRPDRVRMTRGNEKSIITAIYNRLASDAASIDIEHVRLDDEDRYLETIRSGLNNCLTLDANIDQSGRAFIQDVVMSMLDEGVVAIVPVDATINPAISASFDIITMRTAKIIEWFPRHIRVRIYNDRDGKFEEKVVPKASTAIVENPFYAVINEPSSTMQRLIHKLALLDDVDEQSSSGKLDLIIQLPYVIKTDARRAQAENRRKDIEMQLAGSKYGIAYTDATEHITQLNRSVENNMLAQIEYLTNMLYSQMGITQSVLDGTANSETMLNYYNRTVEPILAAITDEMKRKFLSKTARTQGHSIEYFRDPFRLVPVDKFAEIADKMRRNEIMTSNELRQTIGMRPSQSDKADVLENPNLSQAAGEQTGQPDDWEIQNGPME
ncbi:MAG: phage portal protein [Clostridia bacterium]|nr:phage portal protein [Clostridia bacterium]